MKTLSYGNKRCFFSHNHCTENQIFFFQTSWKDGLSKKIALEYDLSRIIGKDHVFLSRNMILTLGGKWKMIFFKKIQGNMIFSSGPPKRRSFQERPRRDMIFFVLSGKMGFFSRKHDIFSWAGNQRQLSQEIHANIFCVHAWELQAWCHASLPKKIKDGPIPQKSTWRWLTF